MVKIPEGFVLNKKPKSVQIPPGFELESSAEPFLNVDEKAAAKSRQPETLGQAFTGELRETEQTKTLPEFSSTEDIEVGFDSPGEIGKKLKMTAGLLSSFSPEGQMNVIKESIPEAQFTQDEKGNTIIDINGRKSVLNKPGASEQDIAQGIAGVIAFLPSAKIAGLVKNVFGKVLTGGATAAATEQGIQEVSRLAGSKEDRDPVKTAIAGVTGGASELVGPARQALKQRKAAKSLGGEIADIAPASESVAIAEEAVDSTGIPLFQAQKTAIPSQVEKQSFLAQLPAGARKASEALKNQNKKAGEAVENFLTEIAPPESIITGAEKFRTAAQKAVGLKELTRSEATSPIYKQAFRRQRKGQLAQINTDKLKLKITKMKGQFDDEGQIAKNLQIALSKIEKAGGDLQKLHLAKTEIDQIINHFGVDSVGKTTKRFLSDVNRDLVKDLVKQSPSYRAARGEFIKLSPSVEVMQESIIGKVAAFDDTALKRVSRTIFDPAETNPQVVLNAKKAIKEVDPEAWNQLLRVELERRLGSITTDIAESTTVENVPRMLEKAIFGNPKQKAILKKAVDGDMLGNLNFLEVALKRAGLGRPGGSQTAIRGEIAKEFDTGVIQSIRNFIKSPIQAISGGVAGTGEEVARNKRIRAAAEMFFNPKYKTELAKIKKIDPNLATAGKATTQLLKIIDSQLEGVTNE